MYVGLHLQLIRLPAVELHTVGVKHDLKDSQLCWKHGVISPLGELLPGNIPVGGISVQTGGLRTPWAQKSNDHVKCKP